MSLTASVTDLCPYCSAGQEFIVDISMPDQEYIEDCEACCQPILCQVTVADNGGVSMEIRRENE